nr:alpha/beta hydrolase [Bacilli bacterium]
MVLANLTWLWWTLLAVGILLVLGLIFSIFLTMYIAKQVYEHTLVRRTPEEWGRVCSALDNEEQVAMWNEGLKWGEENKEFKHEVKIHSKEGLKLCGEFFDFGKEETAIILSGRCECLWYGYYYALPYQKAGYNILVIDNRAHGNSEGKYSTAGILESEDVLRWMAFLKDKFTQKAFVLHCICIGGSTGLLAANTEFGQENIKKICLDGAYINFKESYKRHYIAKGHALFPV